MPELPHRNLDTGMGLERMAAIMQHKTANYDGDLMQHLIKLGEEISGKTYDAEDYSGASRSLRIIADHSRAVDFMISDGASTFFAACSAAPCSTVACWASRAPS